MGEKLKPEHLNRFGAEENPELRLEEFFDGALEAEGEFRDPFGRVRRRFSATVTGTRSGAEIRVHEKFQYDDGETDEREWLIEALGNGRYRGKASDVVGVAEGRVEGRRMRWSYPIDLPIGGRAWRLKFDDIFEMHHPDELINTANVSKFGLPVGSVYQRIARCKTTK
ncbi:DUF3833 family protein [Pyruvatibacter sp.]|uniref:DUF3833 family protein n=1 Tax=Pyruvatibacter sp. TaxID=1981328 RepID=UPI0032EEA8DC